MKKTMCVCVCVCVYKMCYYSALRKKEILTHTTMWMNIEDITLSEISQSQKDKYCLNPVFTPGRWASSAWSPGGFQSLMVSTTRLSFPRAEASGGTPGEEWGAGPGGGAVFSQEALSTR